MKAISPIFQRLKPGIASIEAFFDRVRKRIPGLPSNKMLFAIIGLIFAAVILLAAFQLLLAPKQKFTTYTLPYEQNFDDVNLRQWFVGDGVWGIRTATLAQTYGGDTPTHLHIPFKLPEDISYHASVYITLKKDSRSAGLSFNAQYPNLTTKQHRVYLSRPTPKELELISGFIDDSGSFVNQALVKLPIDTTEFRLDLYVYEKTYLVQVNGQRLIEDRPLFYKNGLIGFYALGPAVFDTFKLTAADNPNPGNMVYTSDFDQDPGGAGWVPFGGAWKIDDKQMVQSDPVAVNAGMGYETSAFQNFTLRVTLNHITGQGAGVLFDMPSPYQVNGAQVVRYSDEADALIWGYFDEQGNFVRQGFANIAPPGPQSHTIQVFSGDTSYDVFLDDQVFARGVPLQNNQGHVGLMTSAASAGFSSVEVYPLFGVNGTSTQQLTPVSITQTTPKVTATSTPASPKPTATSTMQAAKTTQNAASPTAKGIAQSTQTPITSIATLPTLNGGKSPYTATFSGKLADQGWAALNGNWRFENDNFLQLRTDGYDFSTVYTKTAFRDFSYQVGFTHQKGNGAGLLFNMPFTDRLVGASMVRYSDRRDNALIWGYFDEKGVYKNQGYADVTPAGTDHHTLRISSGTSSYSIYLDDKLIVQTVPYGSQQNAGYIGLITSVASVTYDEVKVDGIGAAFKGNYTSLDGFTDQRVISGKWTLTSNKISQTVPNPADYIWNTGVQASQYTLSAKITLPANAADTGAGFVIHMSERGSKNNAYIVRLNKGGQGIWWGPTDENGKFKGQGSATLKPGKSSSFLVKVTVDVEKMSIFVNDQPVATDIPIIGSEGWVGLVAYGGPVTFENVVLAVEK